MTEQEIELFKSINTSLQKINQTLQHMVDVQQETSSALSFLVEAIGPIEFEDDEPEFGETEFGGTTELDD